MCESPTEGGKVQEGPPTRPSPVGNKPHRAGPSCPLVRPPNARAAECTPMPKCTTPALNHPNGAKRCVALRRAAARTHLNAPLGLMLMVKMRRELLSQPRVPLSAARARGQGDYGRSTACFRKMIVLKILRFAGGEPIMKKYRKASKKQINKGK